MDTDAFKRFLASLKAERLVCPVCDEDHFAWDGRPEVIVDLGEHHGGLSWRLQCQYENREFFLIYRPQQVQDDYTCPSCGEVFVDVSEELPDVGSLVENRPRATIELAVEMGCCDDSTWRQVYELVALSDAGLRNE